MKHPSVLLMVCGGSGWALPSRPVPRTWPRDRPAGEIETVATFDGPMPTGVTVSHSGRIFVCYPKWGDKVDFTVAEVKDGKPVAYPDQATNQADGPGRRPST